MNTQQALQTLQSLRSTIMNTKIGLEAQIDALDTSIAQLQGILDTPTQDLIEERQNIAELETQLAVAQKSIEELQKPKDEAPVIETIDEIQPL